VRDKQAIVLNVQEIMYSNYFLQNSAKLNVTLATMQILLKSVHNVPVNVLLANKWQLSAYNANHSQNCFFKQINVLQSALTHLREIKIRLKAINGYVKLNVPLICHT